MERVTDKKTLKELEKRINKEGGKDVTAFIGEVNDIQTRFVYMLAKMFDVKFNIKCDVSQMEYSMGMNETALGEDTRVVVYLLLVDYLAHLHTCIEWDKTENMYKEAFLSILGNYIEKASEILEDVKSKKSNKDKKEKE